LVAPLADRRHPRDLRRVRGGFEPLDRPAVSQQHDRRPHRRPPRYPAAA
jgi:hypothetical protein